MTNKIKDLAAHSLQTFRAELRVPHAAALGDLKTAVSSLNYAEFTVDNVGSDTVWISADEMPTCERWTAFLRDLRRLAWKPTSVPPVARLFYADASDVLKALSGGSGSTGSPSSDTTGKDKGADTGSSGSKASNTNNSGGGGGANNDDSAASGSGNAGGGGGNKAAAKSGGGKGTNPKKATQPNAGAKTAASGNANSAGSNSGNSDSSDTSSGDTSNGAAPSGGNPTNAGNPAGTGKNSGTGSSSPVVGLLKPDILVFSQQNPGDDAAVQEKKRIIADVDFPRPEMLITVWTVQASSTNPHGVIDLTNNLQKDVARYNDKLQRAIASGWDSLINQIRKTPVEAGKCPDNFFNCDFFNYLTNRSIIQPAPQPENQQSLPTSAQDFLDMKEGQNPLDAKTRQLNDICDEKKYCLGYTDLFYPVKPRLTDMLLTLIASKQPNNVANTAIKEMETPRTIAHDVDSPKTCWEVDQNGPKDKDKDGLLKEADRVQPDGPYFDCFWRASQALQDPTKLGVLRAAIADFFYVYKMSQQFPHEFSPYQLSQSAQVLNGALRPLTDAFSEDIAAYQSRLRNQIEGLTADKSTYAGLERHSFMNSGIVTVRTLSGQEAIVDTQTQSYLDVSEPPTISQLLSSMSSAESSGVPKLLSANLSTVAAPALVGALNAFQSAQAQIGRGLKVDLKPRSLSGASSAEIGVTLNIDESADPARYANSAAQKSGDNLSRVAKHDTSTTVRVDSLKIFDVSSLSAVMERSRSRFPLLPIPGFEMPYIGTLLGYPLPASKEYHSSTAVLSAEVVPTAGDLAFSAVFQNDRILVKCEAGQRQFCTRTAKSLQDFFDQPVAAFHKKMLQCLARPVDCGEVQFDRIQIRDVQ